MTLEKLQEIFKLFGFRSVLAEFLYGGRVTIIVEWLEVYPPFELACQYVRGPQVTLRPK